MAEQSESLQDQAYEMIRERIIFAEYKPGTKLGVKELSENLGLGRTPCASRSFACSKKTW